VSEGFLFDVVMMKASILFVLSVGIACVYAQCQTYSVDVHDSVELQTALNEARPGAIINVGAGNYVGPFVAKTSGEEGCPITVRGQGLINSAYLSSKTSEVLRVYMASYVTFDGLYVGNSTFYGVNVVNSSNIVLKSIYLHDLPYGGISLNNSCNCVLDMCVFNVIGDKHNPLSSGYCVGITKGSANNLIKNCIFGGYIQGDAIFMDTLADSNNITQNVFTGSNFSGSQWITSLGTNNLIFDNSFENYDNTKMDAGIIACGISNTYKYNSFNMIIDVYAILDKGGAEERFCDSNKVISGKGLTNGKIDRLC